MLELLPCGIVLPLVSWWPEEGIRLKNITTARVRYKHPLSLLLNLSETFKVRCDETIFPLLLAHFTLENSVFLSRPHNPVDATGTWPRQRRAGLRRGLQRRPLALHPHEGHLFRPPHMPGFLSPGGCGGGLLRM